MTRKYKSFTLIELSTSILIISFLIYGMLSFDVLLDRAKALKLMRRLNEYSRSVEIFYTTYKMWPGNVSEERCNMFGEFAAYKIHNAGIQESVCKASFTNNYYGLTSFSCDNCKRVGEKDNIIADISAIAFLQISGLISTKKNNTFATFVDKLDSYDKIKRYYEEIEPDSFISIASRPNLFGIRTEFTILNSLLYQSFYNKNQVTVFGGNQTISSSEGAISSNIAEIIDCKMDDCNPYSGSIIATKPFIAQGKAIIASDSQSAFCTNIIITANTSAIAMNNAKYNKYNGKSKKYGCNISIKLSDSL